mmetsp:Transcript_43631/g.126950  ORF Transcript_43631/g.126950 Transcript_43631/m.126950 type:complete len:351 (-) Transcript_43631:22-1074(-)
MGRSALSCCAINSTVPSGKTLLEPRTGDLATCGVYETSTPAVGSERKPAKRDRQASPRSPKGKRPGARVGQDGGARGDEEGKKDVHKASTKSSLYSSDQAADAEGCTSPGRSRARTRMPESTAGSEQADQLSPGRRKRKPTSEKAGDKASPRAAPPKAAEADAEAVATGAASSSQAHSTAESAAEPARGPATSPAPAPAPAPATAPPPAEPPTPAAASEARSRPPSVSIAEGLAVVAKQVAGSGLTASEPLMVVGPVASGADADGSPGVDTSTWVRLRALPYEPVPCDGDDNRQRRFVYKGSIVEVPFLPLEQFDSGNSSPKGPGMQGKRWAMVKSKLENAKNAEAIRAH